MMTSNGFSAILAVLLIAVNSQELVKEQCTQKSDVAFVIDSSGSISRSNFQKEKDFVKEVASTFKMGPDQSQIAVISYSDDAQIDVKFGEYSNVNDFNAAVDNVKHQRRRTRIDLALDLAVSSLFTPEGGARPNVAKVMIILTDGKQTNMSGSKSLDVAVRPLQKINVTIFAVGVGNAIDINELLHLVGDNEENLFRARNFNELARDSLSLRLASRTCKRIKPPIEPPPCSSPVDVAFIIDSSGSIGRTNYLKQKNFVKQVAKSFGLAPDQSQAAMVLYSNSASVHARFGQYATTDEFVKAVDGLPYERGLTRIDKALDLAATDIFPEARAGVPKLALLITDGTQTPAADAKGLREASEPLRKAGVRVLALGVGSGVDRDELRLVTETEDDVVVADDFQDLLLKIGYLTSRACELAGKLRGNITNDKNNEIHYNVM